MVLHKIISMYKSLTVVYIWMAQITQSMVDFWLLYKNGELELMEKLKMYPPSMKITIGELSSSEEQLVTVTFKGAMETEEELKMEIIIPSSEGRQGPGKDTS